MSIAQETGLEPKDMLEEDEIRQMELSLDETTAVKLMEIMGKWGVLDPQQAVREMVKRTHLRETNSRNWKSRIADRRKRLQDEVEEINTKLKKIKKQAWWKKYLLKIKEKKLKSKKKLLKARLKEQMKVYRLVDKIE